MGVSYIQCFLCSEFHFPKCFNHLFGSNDDLSISSLDKEPLSFRSRAMPQYFLATLSLEPSPIVLDHLTSTFAAAAAKSLQSSTGRPKGISADNDYIFWASCYIDGGNLALYPFGYGLSYTHFTYESLELDKTSMTRDGEIKVSITLVNDGQRRGQEVVQLYLKDCFSSACRPYQELIGFEKVDLDAGERKTVTFTVNEPMLRYWNEKCEFVSENGTFELSTGYADNLILTRSFELL